MPDLITDWRSWTNQQEMQSATAFPGIGSFTDVEIITNNPPASLAVTAGSVSGTTVTLTVASTAYVFGAATQSLQVGQTVQVTTTGFTTNNLTNANVVLTAVTATTLSFVQATNTPTGSATGGTVQPSEIFAANTLGTISIPTYANTPTQVNAVDPYAGWTAQNELPQTAFGNDFPLTISGVTNTANPTITVTGNGANNLVVGDVVTITGVVGATGVNFANAGALTVASIPSLTTFTVTLASAPGAYTSGGSVALDPRGRPTIQGLTASATN